MEEKKTDRRTLKTKKAICNAMMDLLTQKELHKVTVQEITDIADINRATFYKHYLDVYDLYDQLERDVLIDWGMLVLKLEQVKTKEFFDSLVSYVDEHRNVFRMVFSSKVSGELRAKFEKMLEGLLKKIESEKTGQSMDDAQLSYRTCYRAQGCVAVLSRWLEGGTEPKELISKVLAELDLSVRKIGG